MNMLGKALEFSVDLPGEADRSAELEALAEDMCGHVNALAASWEPVQTEVFQLTDAVVVFRRNKYQGRTLTRSYMASREKTFFWTVDEFTAPGVVGPRRPTMFFHDCWHARQFQLEGQPPNEEEVLIDREQDAMAAQLKVAEALGCDEDFITYLTNYANDREAIRTRLSQGLGMTRTVRPHFEVF